MEAPLALCARNDSIVLQPGVFHELRVERFGAFLHWSCGENNRPFFIMKKDTTEGGSKFELISVE